MHYLACFGLVRANSLFCSRSSEQLQVPRPTVRSLHIHWFWRLIPELVDWPQAWNESEEKKAVRAQLEIFKSIKPEEDNMQMQVKDTDQAMFREFAAPLKTQFVSILVSYTSRSPLKNPSISFLYLVGFSNSSA